MKKLFTIFFTFFSFVLHSQILVPQKKIILREVIHETSGLEFLNDSTLITHNDSGNEAALYFINLNGQIINTLKLSSLVNFDWEDITSDGKNLWIADLGNNMNNRENLVIYKYNLENKTQSSIHLKYSDQKYPLQESNRNFDSEALIYFKNHLYSFTKNNSTPYRGDCKLYKYNLSDTMQTVSPIDSINLGNEGYWKNSVTAADISDDEKCLAVLTYGYLFLFFDFENDTFFKGKFIRFRLPEMQQRESVVFDKDKNIYITDENSRLSSGGFLYYYNLEKLWKGDLYFRETGIKKINLKTKNTKGEGIRLLSLKSKFEKTENYEVEFLKNGKVMEKTQFENSKKLKHSIKFMPDDTYTEKYSIRIYKGKELIYANSIDPFKD